MTSPTHPPAAGPVPEAPLEIFVRDFRLEERSGAVRAACSVASPGLPDTLWFEVPARSRSALDVVEPNWAAVALLYPAMALGRTLSIEAPLSSRLLHALRRDAQDLLVGHAPALRRVEVKAAERCAPTGSAAPGVATGFSGGVDSFTSVIVETAHDVPPRCRLTDLAVFNVGAFDRTPNTPALFRRFADRCDSFAKARGLGSYAVDSNLDDFFAGFDAKTLFQRTHTLRDAAAALLIQNAIGRYVYASSLPYSETTTAPSPAISHIDPILLPLLSTERLYFLTGSPGMTRIDKTALVAEDADAQRMLDVCVANPDKRLALGALNCSHCWKCTRTLLTLEALGRLDLFAQVFDLAYYRTHRTKLLFWLAKRAGEGDLAARDALAFARARNVPLPGRLYGIGQRAAGLGRRATRRARGLLGTPQPRP